MSDRNLGSAPDYTNAALVMLAVNLTWVFVLIWVFVGFLPVLLLALALNLGIDRLFGRPRRR